MGDGENLIDVLRHGQGVLNVLPLAGVKDEVDRRIILLEERQNFDAMGHYGRPDVLQLTVDRRYDAVVLEVDKTRAVVGLSTRARGVIGRPPERVLDLL